jgi:hypothetical protein
MNAYLIFYGQRFHLGYDKVIFNTKKPTLYLFSEEDDSKFELAKAVLDKSGELSLESKKSNLP